MNPKALSLACTISAILWAIIIGVCAFVGQAWADPYALAGGGCIKSTQQSNSDEIEFGSECGGLAFGEGGYTFDQGWAEISLGGEIAHRFKDLHGQNNGSKQTADGETLHITSIGVNARIQRNVIWALDIYGLAGFGGGYATGLDDSDFVPIAQGEAGLSLGLTDNLSIGGGYRFAKAFGLNLDGNSGNPDFHGAVGWLRWSFGE